MNYIYECVSVWVYAHERRSLQGPDDSDSFLEDRVVSGYESPDLIARS